MPEPSKNTACVVGVLAHVDAGKTTFSEQLLYHAGAIRSVGRVDHKNAFMDAHPLERQRGITIFSDQAVFEREGIRYFWLDTPGHADFSGEMERAVSVMDYAVLMINGAEGVQSHTETLWSLLATYGVPVLLFVNKTDRAGFDAERLTAELKRRLSDDIVDMRGWTGGDMDEAVIEAVAERDENALERLLSDGYDAPLWAETLRNCVARRGLFPLYMGSALLDRGVEEFLGAMRQITVPRASAGEEFSALAYKVRRDAQGNRLCFLKILSGALHPRDEINLGASKAKINEIRIYHGEKFSAVPAVESGALCAVSGLKDVRVGDYIGADAGRKNVFRSEAMMAVSVQYGKELPVGKLLQALRELEDEDPALGVSYNEANGAIDLRVMGAIQVEIIRQEMLDRYNMKISFGAMRVLYMETIASLAVGVGHYEPLRHYAEVQLRLKPAPRGSGIRFESSCHVDTLALNWQRLIETHVFEKTHKGVLIGAPLTDVCIELLCGRAHNKHTEGGDFRQSTYRAIRNALMYAESVLLEPICRFQLRAPQESYGRIMGDLNRMQAQTEPPLSDADGFCVTGEVPFARFACYQTDFMAATHGRGALSYRLDHYAPCKDAAEIIAERAYNPLADDTPDSVFCAKGAGYTVPWDQVRQAAHCPLQL